MTALRAQAGVRDTFRANAVTPASDQIVGVGADGLGFHYAGGVLTSLPDLPGGQVDRAEAMAVSADGSIIAGVGNQTEGEGEAVIWHNGVVISLGDLPGGSLNSGVRALTPDGLYAVGYGSANTGIEALRWQLAPGGAGAVAVVSLGNLPGSDRSAMATAVSADGSVVVGRDTFSPGMRAFIWTAADGMRDLKDVLEADYGLDLTDWLLLSANAISTDGMTIVGSGYHYGYGQEAFIVHVPEPSTLVLLVVLGVPVLRKRPVRRDCV
jgi:probable HAF family extracellular repeat protein